MTRVDDVLAELLAYRAGRDDPSEVDRRDAGWLIDALAGRGLAVHAMTDRETADSLGE
jgi:hypothetical protein